jgi:hypothetical protein
MQEDGLADAPSAEGAVPSASMGRPAENHPPEAGLAQAAVAAGQGDDLGRRLEANSAIVAEGVALEAFGRSHAKVAVPILGRARLSGPWI